MRHVYLFGNRQDYPFRHGAETNYYVRKKPIRQAEDPAAVMEHLRRIGIVFDTVVTEMSKP